MKNFVLILFFICSVCINSARCEEIEINSKVLSVNPEFEFFVIAAGEGDGIEIGDGLVVHREGEKIAEAYIIEVRSDVSAAEIFNIVSGEAIHEGDGILIVKETEKTSQEIARTEIRPAYRGTPQFIEQGDVIAIEINKGPKAVFFYAALILRENDYSIISSDRATYTILANKPIDLSLLKELWADAFAAIDHNLVLSIEIKDEGGLSRLTASAFREHSQKNRYIKRAVVKNSKHYNELTDLVYKIKERSEY